LFLEGFLGGGEGES